MDNNIISQEDINNLKIDNKNISLDQELLNIIILCKNELNIIENNMSRYSVKTKEKIKKKLNLLISKIINLRK